jgi:hypothetical protein
LRQSGIDEELFDVVSDFEALNWREIDVNLPGRKRRKQRN